MAGTLIAVPAIGFTAIFAVLRFPNFAIASYATIGAFSAWWGNVVLGLPITPALLLAFALARRNRHGVSRRRPVGRRLRADRARYLDRSADRLSRSALGLRRRGARRARIDPWRGGWRACARPRRGIRAARRACDLPHRRRL